MANDETQQQQEAQEAPAPAPQAKPSEEEVIQKAVSQLEAMEAAAAEGAGELRDTEEPVAEKPAEEQATEAEEPKRPEEVRYAERVAELARRDRLQRQEKSRLAQERADLSKKLEEAEAAAAREKTLREEFQRNPRSALQRHFGLDVVDLLSLPEDENAQPSSDRYAQELKRQQDEIEALKRRVIEKEEREQREKHEQHMGALYENVLGRISGIVQADPDAYEAVLDKGRAGAEDIFTFLNAWYERQVEDGLTPAPPDDSDIREAAKMVEETYRRQELEELKQKATKKRFAGRLSFGDVPQNIANETPAKSPTQGISQPKPTLTNNLTGQPPQKRPLMSEEDRIAAALAIPLPEFKD